MQVVESSTRVLMLSTNSWANRPSQFVAFLSSLMWLSTAAWCAEASCTESVYQGFDSRLTLDLVGRLPTDRDGIRGFEVARGKPLVAFSHRLLGIESDALVSMPSLDSIEALTVDAAGRPRLQSTRGIQTIGASQLQPDTVLSQVVAGRLFNSGNNVFVDAVTKDRSVQFLARQLDGKSIPIVSAKGELRTASWNAIGLAAIVEETLLVWQAGGRELVRLRTDVGLRSARDACLLGPRRAVVALPHVVVLITDKAQIVLVAFAGRCRWADGVLYLLDERYGLIWSVRGIDKIGNALDDAAYAAMIIRALPKDATEANPRFLEAARILGCEKARRLFADRVGSN